MDTLLALVGTSPPAKCCYFFEDKPPVEVPLSVLAMRHFLRPGKTVVLCTEKAWEKQHDYLAGAEIVKIPEGVNEQEFQRIFSSVLENLQDEEVSVDLTQGYRHLPMLVFLGAFLKGLSGGNINMYYAMEISAAQEQLSELGVIAQDGCRYFRYQPIHNYLEIGYISLIFNLFAKSFNIPDIITVKSPPLRQAVEALQIVAQSILENNFRQAINNAGQAGKRINEFLSSPNGQFVKENAQETLALLKQLDDLKKKNTSEQMLEFGRIMLERRYLLSAATFLHEAFLKAVGEYIKIDDYIKNGIKASEFDKSRAIKQLLSHGKITDAKLAKKFKINENIAANYMILNSLLDKVNDIRRTAAHAFAEDDNGISRYESNLKSLYNNFTKVYHFLKLDSNRLMLMNKRKLNDLPQLYAICEKEQ